MRNYAETHGCGILCRMIHGHRAPKPKRNQNDRLMTKTQSVPITCPHLGLAADRTVFRIQPDAAHRCYAQTPLGTPDTVQQTAFCLTRDHPACPFNGRTPAPSSRSTAPKVPKPSAPTWLQWLRFLPWVVLGIALVVIAVVYGRDLLAPVVAAPTPLPRPAFPVLPSPTLDIQTPTPGPTRVSAARFATSTPMPGGQMVALSPKAGEAGWWTSAEARGNHLGDSFLYSGYLNGQAFAAAIRFDLARVPRGAAILAASLGLTGLNAERFRTDAGGAWQVQLLAADTIKEFARADFQTLYNAPAAVTLFPALTAADLAAGQVNQLSLDGSARAWLAQQITEGKGSIIARITGPGEGESLFAWDSGAGPATGGSGPQLLLNLGPAPATPPPLPSQQVIVATLTPTPANVLTLAAVRMTATNQAHMVGTATPQPFKIVTPTALPANVATAQALRQAQGLPPVVIYTATPANAATATADAALATAIAVTTGTFTPVPTHAVTPVVVAPTPVPQNVMTAAAQILAATRDAEAYGTVTPLPFNAVIATITPSPFVIPNTPTPGNMATAAAQAANATAVAFATGTYTPLPPNALTPTAPPPVPLLLFEDQMTPRPSPTPTPTAPASMSPLLLGKILFRSDRDAAPSIYALDVASGRVALVTQDWPYRMAAQGEARSPDGTLTAIVKEDPRRIPQVQIRDDHYNAIRQLTSTTGWSYDPAWSPAGNRIAFVSTEPGNDEIYTINRDGTDMQRLTANVWEWDKHPSWSPDGTQIVFYSNRETGRRQLWIMAADGSNQRLLLDSLYNDWDPVWIK